MARPRKKRRTQNLAGNQNARATGVSKPNPASRIPKSMVIRMGANDVGSSVSQLVRDMRQVMEPHTASRLQERRGNRLRDYTTMAGPLGVTHFMLFYRAKESGNTNMKIAIAPRGPTLSFRVERFSLAKDVAKAQRRPKTGNAGLDHLTPPLLVLNNFTPPQSEDETGQAPGNGIPRHLESLNTSVFQSLFPPISPQRTPLSSIRRILLVNREPHKPSSNPSEQHTYVLHLRHYAITSKPVQSKSLSRNLKRLDRAKTHAQHNPYHGQARDYNYSTTAATARRKASKGALPDLSKLNDVADFLLEPGANGGYQSASESEGEGTEAEVDVVAEPEARKTWSKKERERHRKHEEAADAQRAALQRGSEVGDEVNGGDAVADEEAKRKDASSGQKTQKRAIRLTEIGPRMKLRLYKVEEGLCTGRVMWHETVTKSQAEFREMEEKWKARNEEKERRRKEQRANLERKRKDREAQRAKDKAEGKTVEDDEEDEILDEEEAAELASDADDWDDVDDGMDVDVEAETSSGSEEQQT
ncbi:MAG: hypothetical protein Q9159_007050 [Coniocarpon cinnabarinum]